jgi:nitrogen regulatory protein P-II 1
MPERRKTKARAAARELVVCVLNEPDALHDVLTALLEAGAGSGTVIESQGMGRILSQDVPVFAGFRHLFEGSKPFNHTIFAVVDDSAVTERIFALLQDVLAGVAGPSKGIVFAVPVSAFARLSAEEA